MTGVDNFIQQCKKIINRKAYADFHVPELKISEPMSPRDIALIENETGVRPEAEIKIYKPTGKKVGGYFEYQYEKTITK